MIAITRLNTTISDRNMVANFAALCLLASVSIASGVAISYSGNLAKTSYDTVQPSVQANETSTAEIQVMPLASTITVSTASAPRISAQDQQPNIVAKLQPAQGVTQSAQAATETLQPSANSVQLTGGTNLQNAEAVLQ